jgi:hypothetical protein
MHNERTTEYWQLVHELSLLGWYRITTEGRDGPEVAAWGFRTGHVTDGSDVRTVRERWIAARSETAAMRTLLNELRHHRRASSVHRPASATLCR